MEWGHVMLLVVSVSWSAEYCCDAYHAVSSNQKTYILDLHWYIIYIFDAIFLYHMYFLLLHIHQQKMTLISEKGQHETTMEMLIHDTI